MVCFSCLMLAITTLGLAEFYNLVEKRGLVCFTGWRIVSGLLMMVSTFIYLSGDLVSGASPALKRKKEECRVETAIEDSSSLCILPSSFLESSRSFPTRNSVGAFPPSRDRVVRVAGLHQNVRANLSGAHERVP